jgi:hypothetical protein
MTIGIQMFNDWKFQNISEALLRGLVHIMKPLGGLSNIFSFSLGSCYRVIAPNELSRALMREFGRCGAVHNWWGLSTCFSSTPLQKP